jgi:hypothetical protein
MILQPHPHQQTPDVDVKKNILGRSTDILVRHWRASRDARTTKPFSDDLSFVMIRKPGFCKTRLKKRQVWKAFAATKNDPYPGTTYPCLRQSQDNNVAHYLCFTNKL